jgi:hypothetical protein
MCKRISGTCHTFQVVKVSRSRVHVEYSNPDEYGSPEPVTAIYPCYPSPWPGDANNPRVILDAIRYLGCTGRNEECYQSFDQLTGCPQLWRKGPDDDSWQTEAQTACQRLGVVIRSYWADPCYQYWAVEPNDCGGKNGKVRLFEGCDDAERFVVSSFRGSRTK